ncbi:MAG: transposase, partial [Polyangiaceae bacterium]|nr:transposase [Polyangiaceae bacterium]
TVVQRFGGALNLNVHFHVLVLDGLFVERPDGTLRFEPAPALKPDDLERMLVRFVRRARRLLARHGIAIDGDSTAFDQEPHPSELDEPLLARVHGASLAQRVVFGGRSGLPVRRIGRYPEVEVEGGPGDRPRVCRRAISASTSTLAYGSRRPTDPDSSRSAVTSCARPSPTTGSPAEPTAGSCFD